MKITLSKHAGFCDGVARAFDMVEKIAQNPKTKKPIYVLGSLVHNSDVVKKIEEWGVKKIDLKTLQKMSPFDKLRARKIGTLIITAHGIGPKIYELIKKKKIDVVDTTCPRVIKVQRLAKIFLERDYQIVIVGENNHKEIKGIFGWSGEKARIIETENELKKLRLDPRRKIAVISQTTQNKDFVGSANRHIQKKYPHAEIVGTVCEATHDRQNEVKKLANLNDAVVIIGSPESSNSTRLFEVAKRINSRSYFVERAEQLQKKWFSKIKKVGVTAGASTPDWIIGDVVKRLKYMQF